MSTVMRIAYLTGEYPKATDTFIQREVETLRGLDVEIDTFSVRRPAGSDMVGPEQERERAGTWYILPARPLALVSAHWWFLTHAPRRYASTLRLAWSLRYQGLASPAYQIFYFAEAALLARELDRRGISHLHNHFGSSSCTVAMLAAGLAEIPFSFTLHGPHTFFEPFRWRLDEKIARAAFVCCISHYCRSQAMWLSHPEHWGKLRIVHCGVDPALYEPVTHTGQGPRLLYVGRLSAEKGLPVLLTAMARLQRQCPGSVLTVVGDGPARADLERVATRERLGECVKFAGYQSRAAVGAFLQETDVFVLPSFAEGVPVSLMEAMATGLPVVATNVAGVRELVEDGASGYVVPPGDADSLADRIARLVEDPAQRQQMGSVGRKKIESEFNLGREVARLREILTNTINSDRGNGSWQGRGEGHVSKEPPKIPHVETAPPNAPRA